MHLRIVFDAVRPGYLVVDFNVLFHNNSLPATYRRGKRRSYMWSEGRLMEQLNNGLFAEGTGVFATRFRRQQMAVLYRPTISEEAIKELVRAACRAESDFLEIAA